VEALSAEMVYRVAFEEGFALDDGTLVTQVVNPDRLVFNPYPATLRAELIYNEPAGDSGLTITVVASNEDVMLSLSSLRNRTADHILIANSWFPFAPGAREELLDGLEKFGIFDVGPVTLRQYLALKRSNEPPYWLVDRTDATLIHPGMNAAPPAGSLDLLNGTLYPYQHAGWQWLSYIHREGLGAILADEMGLGKTIQIIALLASPDREKVSPSLIIAPSTVMENWRREIARFAPSLKSVIHQGANRTGDFRQLIEYDVIITSYDTVVRDSGMFRMLEWQIVVLDEAQAIKNPDTKRAVSVKKLRRRVGIAVTGTPVENRLRDLWSLVDFAVPSYLGELEDFERVFVDDITSARRIEPKVSPLMLRRRVAEVAKDLPPRIDIPQALRLTEDEASEYDRIRLETLAQYGGSAALVALTRLRMFCAHPMLLDEIDWTTEQMSNFSKFQRLFELIDEVFSNQEKLLVFTSYNGLASSHTTKRESNVLHYTGEKNEVIELRLIVCIGCLKLCVWRSACCTLERRS
jgi:SNF2 family DNA or RNA helicase